MSFRESVIAFKIGDQELIGIVSKPSKPLSVSVLIIVGGPQYRAGSHRQFTLLARALANSGIPAMRFDYRGMGDSDGEARTFENIEEDIAGAIRALVRDCPSTKSVVLWGLCDGASAAMMFGQADPRVKGMVLLNPWVRSDASLAQTYLRHYYLSRLTDPSLWRKILSGAFSPMAAIRSFWENITQAILNDPSRQKENQDFQSRMLRGLVKFRGRALLILSAPDLTAQEFSQRVEADKVWKKTLLDARFSRKTLPAADHTFSDPADRLEVERLTVTWITETFPACSD